MATMLDAFGCDCEFEKCGEEICIRLRSQSENCSAFLSTFVLLEELKSTIRMLEEEDND